MFWAQSVVPLVYLHDDPLANGDPFCRGQVPYSSAVGRIIEAEVLTGKRADWYGLGWENFHRRCATNYHVPGNFHNGSAVGFQVKFPIRCSTVIRGIQAKHFDVIRTRWHARGQTV